MWLDAEAARALEPLLSPEAVGGWWYPQDFSVDPRALHTALRSACEATGRVEVRHGAEAVALMASTAAAVCRGEDGQGGFTELDWARGVSTFVRGGSTYAIVTAAREAGVQLVDVSDPSTPEAVGSAADGPGGFPELG